MFFSLLFYTAEMCHLKVLVALALVLVEASGSPLVQPRPRAPRVPMLDGRIVGGTPAEIQNYPYQLSLQYFGSHICGASVISENYAATAGHCTDGSSAVFLSLRSGATYRGTGGDVNQVSDIYQNPKYDRSNIDFDISILRVVDPFSFDAQVQPVPLPQSSQEIAGGSIAIVSGWGTTREGGSLPQQLQAVTVPIVDIKTCRKAYGESTITDRMICAGYTQGGKDACQGDSGGPLVANGVLVGIVSWGYGCARPNYPGVYSNVASLREYINEVSGL